MDYSQCPENAMEPILLTLEPEGSTYIDAPHEGEEFGYVLKGSIQIHIGTKIFRALKGDSFYYPASKRHYITNASKSNSIVLWVTTPPNF